MSNKTNPLENLEEELVDYVSNTPNNTNPSVVKSMVRAAADGVSIGGGGDCLKVYFNFGPDGSVTVDKTYAEIVSAIKARKPICTYGKYGPVGEKALYLFNYNNAAVRFWCFDSLSTAGAAVKVVSLSSNETVAYTTVNLAVATT